MHALGENRDILKSKRFRKLSKKKPTPQCVTVNWGRKGDQMPGRRNPGWGKVGSQKAPRTLGRLETADGLVVVGGQLSVASTHKEKEEGAFKAAEMECGGG